MATRIEEILLRVRDTLADPSGARWSTERLVRLVDEAQKDICRQAKILKGKTLLPIVPGTCVYDLPTDVNIVDRILFNGQKLNIVSHADMDTIRTDWETVVSEVLMVDYIVYDKLNQRQIKIYPIPAATVDVSLDSPYGIMAGINGFSMTDLYGVVTEVYITEEEYATTLPPPIASLVLYYIKKPSTVTSINSLLEISDIYDMAIKFYVTGKALKDDMDAQNRAAGNEELNYYERELREATKDSANDVSRNPEALQTRYKGAF